MPPLDETKARLVEAAGELFAELGFEGATVRSICARAGANQAAINYHFGDKEQLYTKALLEAHRCGLEGEDDGVDPALAPREQLRRFVHDFMRHVLAFQEDADWRRNLLLREMMRPTNASEILAREVIRPKFERLVGVLRQVCPEAEERRLHAIAFSVVGQCMHYKIARPVIGHLVGAEELATLDLDYLVDHITTFTTAALGLTPPLDASGISRTAKEGHV